MSIRLNEGLPDVVYDVPAGGWRPRVQNGYNMDVLLKKLSALAHLVQCGSDQGMAKIYLADFNRQVKVYGADMCPGEKTIFTDKESGHFMVNLHVPSDIIPKEGPFPRVLLPFEYFANGDPKALEYQLQAFADKYQNQNKLPKRALVYASAPGVGKGVIYRVGAALFGEKNCATVTKDEVESNFSGRYVRSLFVFADEFMSADNASRRDATQKMKILIDGGHTKLERKHENQVAVRNRTFWMFGSNDPVAPLAVEGADRRYAFFSNFVPPTPEYTTALNSCFEADRTTFTASFREELAGFAHYLLNLKVDLDFISKPFKNAEREALIEAGRPSHETFCREVDEHGFDAVLASAKESTSFLTSGLGNDWDFNEAVAFQAIYKVYRSFSKETGQYPLSANKFGGAVRNHLPRWPAIRKWTKDKRQVCCYVVPRKPNPKGEEQ